MSDSKEPSKDVDADSRPMRCSTLGDQLKAFSAIVDALQDIEIEARIRLLNAVKVFLVDA